MPKAQKTVIVLPKAPAAHVYLDKPDTEAPEGASFKPDGKFKLRVIFDDETPLADAETAIKGAATDKWGPGVDFAEFKFPWTSYDDDAKADAFKGKTVVQAKSQYKPGLVDSKKNDLPPAVKIRGGDIVKVATTLYLYEKTEKVKEKVNGKIKETEVTTRGASLQLYKVQLIEKRAGDGGGDPFDDEDGFVVPEGAAGGSGSADSDGDF